MRLYGLRLRLRRRHNPVTPDELAAIGRPGMIAASLARAELMRPDLHPEVLRLAQERGDTSQEAMYAALKDVWGRQRRGER